MYLRRTRTSEYLGRGVFTSLVVGSLLLGTGGTLAQEGGVPGSVTITAYRCPAEMDSFTLDPSACEPTTSGFDVVITSTQGIMEPYTLTDAEPQGPSYVIDLGPASPEGVVVPAYGQYRLRATGGDDLRTDFVVSGDVAPDTENGYGFVSTESAPNPQLDLYLFLAEAGDSTDPIAPEIPVVPEATIASVVPVEEGTGRLVTLLEGNCEGAANGGVRVEVADLGELTVPIAEAEGADGAIGVETTFATVPVTLAATLADDHAVMLLAGVGPDAKVLACGEVGGAPDAQGAISIGLREVDDSGFSGIAYLVPTDAGMTVSLFVAEGLRGDEQA